MARDAANQITGSGGHAHPVSGPIATREDCVGLVESVLAAHGRLDVLIHNAGWVGYQPIEASRPDFLRRMMAISVDASLWLAQAAWPSMRQHGFGRILLTTSDRAIYPSYALNGLAAYAAAKMAVIGITNALAFEGREHGILVNAISPVAKTRMWGVTDEPDELKPSAIAVGALYLVSPQSQATGWVLRASNGQFVATQAREAEGGDYPRDLRAVAAASPEEFAAAWPRIAVAAPERRRPIAPQVADG